MSELYKKFGELLKLERKRKGLKLEELSDQLKISESSLEYIEEGDVSLLPSKIYYNLFAKAYAEALGIDYERTIEAIKEDIGEAIDEVQPEGPEVTEKKKVEKKPPQARETEKAGENTISIKKLLYLFGAIVVIFIIFLVIYLAFFASNDVETSRPTVSPEPVETTQTTESEADRTEATSEYDWNVASYSEPGTMTLRLIPRNESWSTVLADGDTVIFRNLLPGRVYEAEALYRLTVSVGIPSQVDIELNGKLVNLRDSETGRISRVHINQVNVDQFLSREASPPEVAASPVSELTTQQPSTTATDEVVPDDQQPDDTLVDSIPGGNSNDED